jgi:hypothetical protein
MKLVKSNQKSRFIYCPNPVTIDKRKSWGNDESNFQQAPDGAFLKIDGKNQVSHLVQPKSCKMEPIGWTFDEGETFEKDPIWVSDEFNETDIKLKTKDGVINYEVTEPSVICCNGDSVSPDYTDPWIQKVSELKKNYVYENCHQGDLEGLLKLLDKIANE